MGGGGGRERGVGGGRERGERVWGERERGGGGWGGGGGQDVRNTQTHKETQTIEKMIENNQTASERIFVINYQEYKTRRMS